MFLDIKIALPHFLIFLSQIKSLKPGKTLKPFPVPCLYLLYHNSKGSHRADDQESQGQNPNLNSNQILCKLVINLAKTLRLSLLQRVHSIPQPSALYGKSEETQCCVNTLSRNSQALTQNCCSTAKLCPWGQCPVNLLTALALLSLSFLICEAQIKLPASCHCETHLRKPALLLNP